MKSIKKSLSSSFRLFFRLSFHLSFWIVFQLSFYATSVLAQSSVNVLWWNVGGANFANGSHDGPYSREKLEPSLIQLVSHQWKTSRDSKAVAPVPDVMMFGEYYEGFFSSQTLEILKETYPYQKGFLYNNLGRDLVIKVFSKVPFYSRYRSEALTWASQAFQKTHPDDDLVYLRSFQSLHFEFLNQRIHLVPMHLAQPWERQRYDDVGLSQHNGEPFMGALPGTLEVIHDILYSDQNPLGYQAKVLQKVYQQEQEEVGNSTEDVWLRMGDCNIPNQLLGVTPKIYSLLKGQSEALALKGDHDYTYPANADHQGLHKKMQIDHVFYDALGSFAIQGEILDLQGSDHYPVLVTLQN